MPEINLPTAGKQDTILANTNAINTNVETNKSTLATINENTSATNNNLGSPTSGANSSTGANAHAKLNYINSTLGTINTRLNGISSNASEAARHAGVYKSTAADYDPKLSNRLTINGKGVLRRILGPTGEIYVCITIDGVIVYHEILNASVYLNIPFNNSLKIDATSGGVRWVYELY